MENAEQLTDLLTRWAGDPVAFVIEALGVTPESWQAEVLNALVDEDRIAIRSGHGVGKSALLAWIVLWSIITKFPQKIACTAPTSHQLEDVLWGEIALWKKKLPEGIQNWIDIKSDKVELKSAPKESFCVARTARVDRPEAFQGFHSENMLFLVDEASGVEDIIFEVGAGAMSTKGAKTILTGNPTRSSGYFFDAFHKMREHWHTMKVSCEDSTRVDHKFISEMEAKYGGDSNIFRVRVLGEFPLNEDDVLMPLDLIEAAVERDIVTLPMMPVWGLDVARFGNCRTALCKRKGNTLLEPIKSWHKRDLMEVSGLILAEFEDTLPENIPAEILVDAIGLGAGVVDRLKELGLPVRGINVGETPSKAGFNRLKDELWWRCREWFESREVNIPEDDKLISQLTNIKYKYTSVGKIQIEGKDDLMKRGLESPDEADSLVLTMAGLDRRGVVGTRYDRHPKRQWWQKKRTGWSK